MKLRHRLEQAWICAEQSEITLVHSAQAGDLEAFNALALKYQDVMYRTALHILGQDTLAEDATQDAFISAYQHIGHFRDGSLKAWFIRILVNKCYDEIRRIQRTAITLIDLYELDYQEAARILRVPLGTIKSRLARARYQLRKRLQEDQEITSRKKEPLVRPRLILLNALAGTLFIPPVVCSSNTTYAVPGPVPTNPPSPSMNIFPRTAS